MTNAPGCPGVDHSGWPLIPALPYGVSLGLADKVSDVHLYILQRVMEANSFVLLM